MNRSSRAWLLFALVSVAARAADGVFIYDVEPGLTTSVSGLDDEYYRWHQMTRVGTQTFFRAFRRGMGTELWVTDGTAAGTKLVRDLWPGPDSSFPSHLIAFKGSLYFVADDGSGRSFWRSDGTATGTELVKRVAPSLFSSEANPFIELNGELYFGVSGDGLWKSDGTETGTVWVCAFGSVTPQPTSEIHELAVADGALFFSGDDGALGKELYRYPGFGTLCDVLTDVYNPGSASTSPLYLTPLNNALYFVGVTPAAGRELMVAGASSIPTALDVTPGPTGMWMQELVAASGKLFFVGDASSSFNDAEVWSSDGTVAGTSMVVELKQGPGGSNPRELTEMGGIVYFAATPSTSAFLYRTDGTANGTTVINPVAAALGNLTLTALNGLLYVSAWAWTGASLWVSDGTSAGTTQIAAGGFLEPLVSGECGSSTCVVAADQWADFELYVHSPGSPGLSLLKEISPEEEHSRLGDFVQFGARAFFTAGKLIYDRKPWVTDGSVIGTASLDVGSAYHYKPVPLGTSGGRLFFSAERSSHGVELWVTDGTLPGTVRLTDVCPGMCSTTFSQGAELDGEFYFVASHTNGSSLWKSDGTAAGTAKVKNLVDAPTQSAVTANGLFFFPSMSGTTLGLWKSDGTSAGTEQIQNAALAAEGVVPYSLVSTGTHAYFLTTDASARWSLWCTDGIAVDRLATFDFSPSPLTAAGGRVYFSVNELLFGVEPWVSDGTAAGTKRLKDIAPGRASSNPSELRAFGERLIFSAWDSAHGREIWLSDGTSEGTSVIELLPGASGGDPTDFEVLGSEAIAFVGADPEWGRELWFTDGTPQGTRRAVELVPGPASSSPRALTLTSSHLMLAAYDDMGDEELWGVPLGLFDSTPPLIEVTIAGPQAPNGFYVGDVIVSFSVRDPGSPVVEAEGCGQRVISTDGIAFELTCRARSAGGTSERSVSISRDTTAPKVFCPPPISIEAVDGGGALVHFEFAPPIDVIDPRPSVSASPASGSLFPLGQTEVTIAATDHAGNQASCRFTVAVVDTTPPTLTCPERVTAAEGDPAEFSASAKDAVDPAPTIEFSVPIGTPLQTGMERVRVTARDAAGNASTCEFPLEVAGGVVVAGCGCSDGGGAALWPVVIPLLLISGSRRRRGRVTRVVRPG